MSTLFEHHPHPRIEQRRAESPAKVAEQHKADTPYQRFNKGLAVSITSNVGTMTSAYLFCVLAFLSLPAVLAGLGGPFGGVFPAFLVKASLIALIAWIAQTFLQLVLLPIIIVGQNVQAEAADKRAEATYEDADAVLHEALQIQSHLEAQDAAIERILALVTGAPGTAGGSGVPHGGVDGSPGADGPPPVSPS
ncbi:MAG TPA: hypothetical protein VND44_07490 [Acidimicrobiales bacterium]|nr:hypothetical protein [Acidimicrobiales bacterium]